MQAKVDILARYGGFFQGCRKSPSYEVTMTAGLAGRDVRTTTGGNLMLRLLRELSGLDPWVFGSSRLKEDLIKSETKEVPPLGPLLVFLA